MAIYHFHVQVISRSEGRSSVAAAAYRHRAQMTVSNDYDHKSFDYAHKDGDLVHEELALPDQTPEWFRTLIDGRSVAGASETLWNAVEAHETRVNAQLAREIVLALPSELSREENIALVQAYVGQAFLSRGMVADWVYHDKENNPHVHVMLTLAPLNEKGFGSKWETLLDENGEPVRKGGKIQYRAWAGDKETLKAWRELWAVHANKSLELAGHDARIDHRSYEAQGIELQPTSKIGVQARNIVSQAKAQGRDAGLERSSWHAESRLENVRRITRRPEIVIDAITREKSVFDERDVAKYLHRYVDDPGRFQDLLARVLNSPDVVKLAVEAVDPETGEMEPAKFTSREMMRLEAEMARRADHLVSVSSHGVDARLRDRVLVSVQKLSDEQRVAIERITGDERMASVVGRAGAGKTTMMKAARQVWEANGYQVVGAALAGKAAEGLEKEAGIASRTLASWQLSWGRGEGLPDSRSVFVIDEAGMVDSRQMSVFVEMVAKAGAKLVLIGDAEQLQPIEAGAAFRSLTDRTGYAELGTIYRQREQWMRDASMDLARGNVAKAIHAYQANGHVISMPLKDQVFGNLIDDWSRDYDPSKSMLMLAHLREDVHRLNRMARQVLIDRGVIETGEKFRTEEGDRLFAAGDQIVFLKNDRDLNVKNGMIGRVIEAGEGRILAEIGDIGSDQIRCVEVNQKTYRNVDHGYATTIHKSQGATVDKVKVLATLSLNRHLTYVAMTRHREDVKLYHGALSFAKSGGLIEVLSRKGAKDTTLDYAGSELYAQALSYANSRGLYGLRVAKALVQNQRRWFAEQKAKLSELGERLLSLGEKLGIGLTGLERGLAGETNTVQRQSREHPTTSQPWIAGVKMWAMSIPDAVEDNLQSDATLTTHWAEVQNRARLVFEQPEQAVKAMRIEDILKLDGEAQTTARDRLAEELVNAPEQFGALRGKTGLLAGKVARENREQALNNIPQLSDDAKTYIRLRAEIGDLRSVELERERDLSRVDIPALSPAAETVLSRIRDAVDRNDLNAGLSFLLADKMVEAELGEVAAKLDQRFGERAFVGTAKPEGVAFEKAAALAADDDRVKLAEAWPKFNAIQKINAKRQSHEQAQVQALKKDLSKDQGMTR
ncbi:Ti-type conjugative transfer relaxase TraA [Roseibium sediminicola]|uniref:Ti-type conjugative transfer relaxase TraA n=1 Tax=Roseibium sediminicola TaxID=2933272 RepID=A0ABT0H219_9HYPH|nr:Ti-type conjugative transfer relaxase TraA [Roseibium sp. CAU 1639]MCK7615737.1 Ti-type conjugative transfer relaxase TraA [Roseibium sp. CAU 1639]